MGGRVTGIAVDPFDSQRILVGGDMLGVGLTTNGGQTWQATTGFASWEINEFTWDPVQPRTVWVGTLSGPYLSTDGGETWTAMRNGMPTGDMPYSAPIEKVLIDSSNDQHLLAVGGSQRQMLKAGTAVVNYGEVYQSLNGGQSWTTISSLGTNANILNVVASPDLSTVYAAVLGIGVLRSVDGGQTWQPVNAGLPSGEQVSGLTIDPTNSNVVWAALSHSTAAVSGIYQAGGIDETVNGGQTWSPADAGLPQSTSPSAASATSMYSVYRAGNGTLWTADQGLLNQGRYSSTDGGVSWTKSGGSISKAMPAGLMPYAWGSSADGSLVVGGTSDSIIATSDAGTSWSDIDSTQTADGGWHGNGYTGLLGTQVAFDAAQPGTMFLTAFDAGNLLRSTTNAASWTRPLQSWDQYDGGYDVQAGGTGGEVVYAVLGQAGAFNGIAVSQNTGANFTVSVGGSLPARYTTGAGQGSISIASANGAVAFAVLPNRQLYETTNTGASWTPVSLPSPAYSVATSPDLSVTYVGTDNGIYAITDSAAPNPVLLSGSPDSARQIAVSKTGTIYAVGPLGTSLDGLYAGTGMTWTKLVTSWYVGDVAVDPTNPRHIVYVSDDNPYHATSSASGVWTSCDGGVSFAQENLGLPMTRVMSVAFDPAQPEHVVVGLNGRGFWQTNLPTCS